MKETTTQSSSYTDLYINNYTIPYTDSCQCYKCQLLNTAYCSKCSIPNSIAHTSITNTDPNVSNFSAISHALSAQYKRKNESYGDSFGKSVRRYGVISALTRMSDKWNRLESLLIDGKKNEVGDESVDDTLLDLATYCIMTVMALRNEDDIKKIIEKLEGR